MSRIVWLGCLFLHLALVGAGPIVDARSEVEALAPENLQPHAEEPACGGGYSHQTCLIRALESMEGGFAAGPDGVFLNPSPHHLPPVSFEVPVSSRLSALGPRAPPAV